MNPFVSSILIVLQPLLGALLGGLLAAWLSRSRRTRDRARYAHQIAHDYFRDVLGGPVYREAAVVLWRGRP